MIKETTTMLICSYVTNSRKHFSVFVDQLHTQITTEINRVQRVYKQASVRIYHLKTGSNQQIPYTTDRSSNGASAPQHTGCGWNTAPWISDVNRRCSRDECVPGDNQRHRGALNNLPDYPSPICAQSPSATSW